MASTIEETDEDQWSLRLAIATWFSLLMVLVGLLLVLNAPLKLSTNGQPGLIELHPVADAFVVSTRPDENFGAAGALAISGPMENGSFETLLRFNTAMAKEHFDATYGKDHWTLESVQLRLNPAVAHNNFFNSFRSRSEINVQWLLHNDWNEGQGNPHHPEIEGVTWNSVQEMIDMNSPIVSKASEGEFVFEVQSELGEAIVDGQEISLRLYAADERTASIFHSQNFGASNRRPLLIVAAKVTTAR